jgi:hypothetical protein
MRDIISISFHGEDSLIIASDNSGAIGMKKDDLIHVPYEMAAYYSFRVAVMECIAAGGWPISVVLHNFCGNEPWDELVSGIHKGLLELGLQDIPISGSTESNFSLMQSALGLLVLGKKPVNKGPEITYTEQLKFAVVGMPLVGNEVIEQEDQIVPLSIFQEVSSQKDVMIWPVGSKGILFELNQMFPQVVFKKDSLLIDLDILKSSGPATCFIVGYHAGQENEIMMMTGEFFHAVQIIKI